MYDLSRIPTGLEVAEFVENSKVSRYLDDHEIRNEMLVLNGWGVYEVNLEGGHQFESSSNEPNNMDHAFLEGISDSDSAGCDENDQGQQP